MLEKFVTEFIEGSVICFKEEQALNAEFKVVQLLRLVGNTTDVKFVHVLKQDAILVTPVIFDGNTIDCNL